MRALKACPTPGCPGLVPPGRSRCTDCARAHDKARGSRQQRGYDAEHDRRRRAWAPRVARGSVSCARCGELITPGQAWDLGHTDDRTGWTGPEHATCNRSAGGASASRPLA